MYLNHLILYFLSFVDIQNHQISTRQVIVYVGCQSRNAFLQIGSGVMLFTQGIKFI
jgi:hypothetical protein